MAPFSQAYRRFLSRLEVTRTLGVSFGLDRMTTALAKLGDPQRQVPAVHIAGTNGKGSTAAMTEAVLRAAGRKTGLFTSPHLCRFTERIRLEGREIDGDWLAELGERVLDTQVPLTYFEVGTAAAFLAMAAAKVDVAVLEVGLGGRLDSTNVCVPLATAITSIGLDHTDLLGETLTDIAGEKAGIAKPGVPLFLGVVPGEARREIERVAAAVGAPVVPVDPDAGGPSALAGAHQRANAAVATALAREVARLQGFALSEVVEREALAAVVWPGRLERVAPDVLLDAAHNVDGARALVAALPAGGARALVTSVVRGKAAAEMLAVLAPHFDAVFVTRSASARSLLAEELAALVPAGPAVHVVPDPAEALRQARAFMKGVGDGGSGGGGQGLVVVAGSIFLVGELRAPLLGEPIDPVVTGDPLP